MCSLLLTHPSAHTLGAVGSRHRGARGAVGGSVPCSRVSPQLWTIPAGAEIRTHNLGLQVEIDRYIGLPISCPLFSPFEYIRHSLLIVNISAADDFYK